MKKIILIIAFLMPACLEAQESLELGQSKQSVRLLLKHFAHDGVRLTISNDSDVIIMGNNIQKTIVYYKNNFLNRISSTMYSLSKEAIEQQLLKNSFKKISENELINVKKNIRIDLIVNKRKNEVTIIQSQIDKK